MGTSSPLSDSDATTSADAMQFLALFALCAAASASTSVVYTGGIGGLPFTGLTHPTYYNSISHPSFVSGGLPLTYSAGVIAPHAVAPAAHAPPLVYSAPRELAPLVYSSGVVSPVVSGVVPKYYAETKGTRHIVNA